MVKRFSNNTMSKVVKGLSKASSSCFFSTPKHFFDRRMAAFFLDLFLVREEFPSRVFPCTKYNSLDKHSCYASVRSRSLVIVIDVVSGVVANCKLHFALMILYVSVDSVVLFFIERKMSDLYKTEKNVLCNKLQNDSFLPESSFLC